jgi:hypothetical protein
VNSGKRLVSIASLFGAGLLFAATVAHAPATVRASGILVAAELVPTDPQIRLLECSLADSPRREELRFERITAEPEPEEMRRLLSRGAQRTVDFEWNDDSGELTYDTPAAFTPPADHGAAASSPASASCVSR